MSRIWTPNQKKAIDLRDTDLLVTAGAGSGKTAVLTERITQLILEGTKLQNMLVVTFTNAAATEMKQRIQTRLEEIAGHGETSIVRNIARTQLDEFDTANISTLHSFCISILRRHFYAAGIDPAFQVGDSYECAIMRQEALEDVLEEQYALHDPGFLLLEEGLTDKANSLEKVVVDLYNFLMSQPQPWVWLDAAVTRYDVTQQDIQAMPEYIAILDGISADLALAGKKLCDARSLLPGSSLFDKARQKFSDDILLLDSLAFRAKKGDYSIGSELQEHKFTTMASVPKKEPSPLEKISTLRAEASDLYKPHKGIVPDPEKYAQQICAMQPAVKALARTVKRMHEVYRERKGEKSLLDFNDLEHFALQVLQDQSICSQYRERFTHIFVDEYQDSNQIQEDIIGRIARPGSMFCVGDIKQSIYRFRSSDPTIFLQRMERVKQGKTGQQMIALQQNFRSTPNVLHAINEIFYRVMPLSGELEYMDEDALVPARIPISEKAVTVSIINKKADTENADDQVTELDGIQYEAYLAAEYIRRRMREPIYDAQQQRKRPITYRDFTVLMRTVKGTAEAVARIFSQEGIPCYAELRSNYFEAIEVQVLLNLLRIVDNLRQDIPLLSVLRSGIGNFTDDDIIAIRQRHMTEVNFYDAFFLVAEDSDDLGKKCRELLSLITQAKEITKASSLEQTIEWLLTETNYDILVSALPGGPQRRANLDALLYRARKYDQSSSRGLYGFLRYLERLREAGQDMGEARLSGAGGDCVRIMSVHSSKGLEFPVVLLLGIGKKFNLRDTYKKVVIHKTLGVGVKYFDMENRKRGTTFFHQITAERLKREARAEEMRMLYVAMTRAKEELMMIGSVNVSIQKAADKWLLGSARESFLDFLMDALMQLNASQTFCEDIGIEKKVNNPGHATWELKYLGAQEVMINIANQADRERLTQWIKEARKVNAEEVNEYYKWKYQSKAIQGKVTVSSLAAGKLSFDDTPRFLTPVRMTAADRGTAGHAVLELLDWKGDLTTEGILRQMHQLAENEYISIEQMKAVDAANLARFCASDLGERMKHATKIYREVPFTLVMDADTLLGEQYKGEQTVLQGVIDAYFEEDNAWVLVDYKSDKTPDKSEEGLKKAANQHSEQINLYARALNKLTGKTVTQAYIFLLSAGAAVPIPLG